MPRPATPLQHLPESALLLHVLRILSAPGPVTPDERDDLLCINIEFYIRELTGPTQ